MRHLLTKVVAEMFQRAGVVCSVVENLALERWRKLVWNIPFNGLSIAHGGIDTAAILSDDCLRAECVALMNETIVAAGKCGFLIPDSVVREEIERTELMGAYKPSTLIDFQAGRPLEVEAIWGEPLRQALNEPLSERHRLVLQELHHHIDFLEQQLRSFNQRILAAMAA